jgi:hypothetical protein
MSRLPEVYPDAPGFKVSGPSEQAAEAMRRTAKTLREQVLREIVATPAGLTADQIADRLNRSVLSVRPRVSELNRQGEIRQSGARGRNDSGMSAAVWVVAPPIAGGVNG